MAAAEYLSELYRTLAQASGLLVVASYNYGPTRIVKRLRDMPDPDAFQGMERNPRSRSYWRFYREYSDRLPQQTKDYVLRIFSLAVIGQDPEFFGIDMSDPLAPFR